MNDADKVDAFGYPTAPEQFSQALRPIVTATVETLQAFPEDAPAAAPEQLNQTLKPIAAASSETLEALPGATTAATEPAGDDDRSAIFIADVADTLRPLRRQLVTRIGDRARLLDNIPPPLERTAHDRAVVDALDQADLSIHLLDQWPGREIEDDESTSYPRHQADLAATSGSRSLIWVPESLTEEDFDDKEQLAWLEQMEQASRDSGGYQLVRSGREPFIAQVLETLDRIAAQRADADTGPAQFLIDTHRKDQRYAFSLAAGLAGRIPDLVVDFTRDAEGPDGWKQFDDAVHRARDLIVLFGQVAPDWVRRRVTRAYQVAFGSADSNLESIWVMLLPSCPGMPRLSRRWRAASWSRTGTSGASQPSSPARRPSGTWPPRSWSSPIRSRTWVRVGRSDSRRQNSGTVFLTKVPTPPSGCWLPPPLPGRPTC